jgi:hypothetical protein
MTTVPVLLTPGRIAAELHAPLHRVLYVLSTRQILPAARAGTLRLYDRETVSVVRNELQAIEARKSELGAQID